MYAKKQLILLFASCLFTLGCTGSGSNNGGPGNVNDNNDNQNNGDNNGNNNGADAGSNNATPDIGLPDTGDDDDAGMPCEDLPYMGNVNFKKGRRFNADLARGLSLGEDDVCTELGEYQCAEFTHRVALGDPEPYSAGVYDGSPQTSISTALIVERMAMAGCINRVDADFSAGDSAVIFKGLDPRRLNPMGPEATFAITTLYRGLLLREPSVSELTHLQSFYSEVVASSSQEPGRDWAVLSCFAIASSIESTFY